MIGARAACAVLLVVAACGGSRATGSDEPAESSATATKAEVQANRTDGEDGTNDAKDSTKAENKGAANSKTLTPLVDADFPVVFGVFQSMSRAVIDNAGNCNGMAAALLKIVASHDELLARLRAAREDGALNQRFMAAYGAQVQQTMTQMAPIAQACSSHPGVKKVFENSL